MAVPICIVQVLTVVALVVSQSASQSIGQCLGQVLRQFLSLAGSGISEIKKYLAGTSFEQQAVRYADIRMERELGKE